MNFQRNIGKVLALAFFSAFLALFNGCGEVKNESRVEKEVRPEKETEILSRSDSKEAPEYMAKGKKVYGQYCLSCHQADGRGVSRLNPPLRSTVYVLGDKNRLLGILINGSNIGLDIDGEIYSNAMPAFRNLSDEEIAHVASYIRNSFGNSATPITIEEVSSFRLKNDR